VIKVPLNPTNQPCIRDAGEHCTSEDRVRERVWLMYLQHSEMVHAAYQTLQDAITAAPSTPATSDKPPPSLMSPL